MLSGEREVDVKSVMLRVIDVDFSSPSRRRHYYHATLIAATSRHTIAADTMPPRR